MFMGEMRAETGRKKPPSQSATCALICHAPNFPRDTVAFVSKPVMITRAGWIKSSSSPWSAWPCSRSPPEAAAMEHAPRQNPRREAECSPQ